MFSGIKCIPNLACATGEVLCANFVVHMMDFVSTVRKSQEKEMRREKHENGKTRQDKGHFKTKGLQGQQFQKKEVKTKGDKNHDAKRKACQENGMWRGENVKRRRYQEKEMPTDKDAKRQRRQRKVAEKTSVSTAMTSEKHGQDLSGESVSSLGYSCHGELSRFGANTRKPEQEKVVSSEKDAARSPCPPKKRDDASNCLDMS